MSTASIPFAILSDHTYLYSNTLAEQHREQYHRKQLDIICPECGVLLMIALSKGTYYFKHFPNQSCILDSNKIQKEYLDYIVTQSYESEKHKSLKNALMAKLAATDDPSIDQTSICIEKFTYGRRADVYCERNGEKFAFEIQVSPLSLSIILDRIDHYRKKNIHLFWVIEPTEFHKPQFQRDIKHYGLSEHIYELSLDDKLLKCHFKAPQIYYKNGSLYTQKSNAKINIDLSDLKIINEHPALFDYKKEEEKLKNHIIGTNPIFKDSYATISTYLTWFEKYPELNQKNIFQATRSIDFIPYIQAFHSKFIHCDSDEPDSNPYMYLDCPICPTLCEYNGRIEIQNNIGSCIYCNYKNIDLIQYIADMHHNGNKLKAAQKISQTLTIPYSDSKTT